MMLSDILFIMRCLRGGGVSEFGLSAMTYAKPDLGLGQLGLFTNQLTVKDSVS